MTESFGGGGGTDSLRTPMMSAEPPSAATNNNKPAAAAAAAGVGTGNGTPSSPAVANGNSSHALPATAAAAEPGVSPKEVTVALVNISANKTDTTQTNTTDDDIGRGRGGGGGGGYPLKSVFSWRAHSVSANPNPLSILSVIVSVFIIPLGLTMCWVLLPLDVNVDTAQVVVIDSNTGATTTTCNAWMISLFYWTYFTLSQCWFSYCNQRVVGVWDMGGVDPQTGKWRLGTGPISILFGAGLHGTLSLILRVSNKMDGLIVLTLVMTVSSSVLSILFAAYLVTRKYSANSIDTAIERSARLGTCLANFIGMVVMSSAWGTLQYMSQQFNSHGTGFGEQVILVIAFPVAFFIGQQLLDLKDGLSDPIAKWEVRYFWQFGLLLLYYCYYRNLFLSVSSWGDFALYTFINLLTEFMALIQLAEWYIRGRDALADYLIACCPNGWSSTLAALGVKDVNGHIRKISQTVWLKESVRIFSIIAQLIFFPTIRSYRNESYYPVFNSLPDDKYNTFLAQLGVMLIVDLSTAAVLFYCLYRLYGIAMNRVGADVLLDRSFVISVSLLAIHVTNDPYFSLFQCNAFLT